MTRPTFEYIVHLLRPFIAKRDRRFRKPFPIEKRVAITLWRLAKGNSYRSAGKNFAVAKSATVKIANEFCKCFSYRDCCDFFFPKTVKETPEVQKQPSEVFFKKGCFFRISQNSQENTCARVSF